MNTKNDLITFRLAIANEALEAVDLLQLNKKYRSAVNRMYFAVYYKLLALAAKNGFKQSSYRELRNWLEKTYVDKKQLFESDVLLLTNIHQKFKEIGFDDFSEVTEDESNQLYAKTQHFLEKLQKLIDYVEEEKTEEKTLSSNTSGEAEKIIVPWDFSPVAENALEHAIKMAETVGGSITLLHLVKKQKEVSGAFKNLNRVAENAKHKFESISEVLVRVGNIFDSINDIATELNAKMIIMGTHGITGMQKYTGSKALKVIAGTQIPFMVVQARPVERTLRNVILPIDDRKEIREKMNQVRFLSKLFDVTFHLCIPMAQQVEGVKKRLNNNVNFVKSYMKQFKIDYEEHRFEAVKEVTIAVDLLIERINPDLVLIITTKDIAATDYLLGAEEQKIIANQHKVPVMCISPARAKRYSYGSGTK